MLSLETVFGLTIRLEYVKRPAAKAIPIGQKRGRPDKSSKSLIQVFF
jgi:hypothetical protein